MPNEVEADGKVHDVTRKLGITEPNCCRWKSKYGGLEALDMKRLKTLEDESPFAAAAEAEVALLEIRGVDGNQ